MTRTQALTIARRLYGSRAAVRENRHASSPEQRADATRRAMEAKARLEAIETEIKERLAALPWYVALVEERARMTKQRSDGRTWMHYHRCIIGRDIGIAFEVKAEGDTWADAARAAEAERAIPPDPGHPDSAGEKP